MNIKTISIKGKLKRIFKVYTGMGALLFAIGNISLPQQSIGLLLVASVLAGIVLGCCFRNLSENALHSSSAFYEFRTKINPNRGTWDQWRPILKNRVMKSGFSSVLILAILVAPLISQIQQLQPNPLYFMGMGLFIWNAWLVWVDQLKGIQDIKAKTLVKPE